MFQNNSKKIKFQFILCIAIFTLNSGLSSPESSTIIITPSSSPSPISSSSNNTDKTYSCIVIGECERCTPLETLIQYCSQYGNKEPIKCSWDIPGDNGNSTGMIYDDKSLPTLPNYRPCKRVKIFERTKYFEFQFINIFIAFLSCSLLVWRRKKLEFDGYRRLTRRIGDTGFRNIRSVNIAVDVDDSNGNVM